MSLPEPIITILVHFRPLLSQPSYQKMLWLVCGTLVARGRRTVTAALKMLGFDQQPNWPKYHQLLSRANWSGLHAARILLGLLVTTFLGPNAPLEVVVDETLERRWGRNIKKKSHWRDSLASSRKLNVSSPGLRWLVAALVVRLPWSTRRWALPFASILLTTPSVSEELHLKHQTHVQRTSQLIHWLRRSFPNRSIKVIGDGAYSVINLGLLAQQQRVSLIAPLRLDARLFQPAPAPSPTGPRRRGRPRKVGGRLPLLSELAADQGQEWELVELEWYGGVKRGLYLLSGVAVWYSPNWAEQPLLVRWVLVRDPKGRLETKAYFSTEPSQSAVSIAQDFVKRWNIEVTFEESRAHLGIETQRQWSDKAIERTTPVLLGLYSLSCLMAQTLSGAAPLEIYRPAWYNKSEATFSDVLATVRKALWGYFNFETCPSRPDVYLIPASILDRLAFAACY